MAETVATVRNPIFARLFARMRRQLDEESREHLRELVAGLSGRVMELGAGTGVSFEHYPREVDELVAVEPEPYLRARAVEAAADAPIHVTVVDAVAQALPFEAGSFDAVVAPHVLCTVSDLPVAVRELRRVVRPGGELRFLEHVVSERRGLARVQRVITRSGLWPLISGGCHADRDTVGAIEQAGFELEACRSFPYRPCPIAYPVTPHVLGAARRPE